MNQDLRHPEAKIQMVQKSLQEYFRIAREVSKAEAQLQIRAEEARQAKYGAKK